VILAVSYEARRQARGSVRAGMPLGQALRVLPADVVVVPPDHSLYSRVSDQIYSILQRFSPLVLRASIDEAFLDWTGSLGPLGDDPLKIATELKAAIRTEVGITVSVGIGWSKVSAKMAAELQKPDGLTWLNRRSWAERVHPLPVGELWGVGPKTVPKLHTLGIYKVADLAGSDPVLLRATLGEYGEHIWAAARGDDTEPLGADLDRQARSISHSVTLARDIADRSEQKAVLLSLCDLVGTRLRRSGYLARTVGIQIRTPAFRNFTRHKTFPSPTDITNDIYAAACALLDAHWPEGRPVRLLGVAVSGLVDPGEWREQALAFDDAALAARRRQVDHVIDAVRERFGERALMRGTQLESHRP